MRHLAPSLKMYFGYIFFTLGPVPKLSVSHDFFVSFFIKKKRKETSFNDILVNANATAGPKLQTVSYKSHISKESKGFAFFGVGKRLQIVFKFKMRFQYFRI
jgi:hypothetical protein